MIKCAYPQKDDPVNKETESIKTTRNQFMAKVMYIYFAITKNFLSCIHTRLNWKCIAERILKKKQSTNREKRNARKKENMRKKKNGVSRCGKFFSRIYMERTFESPSGLFCVLPVSRRQKRSASFLFKSIIYPGRFIRDIHALLISGITVI